MSGGPELDELALLDDYTSGQMSDPDAEAFEEALFARAAHGAAPEAEFVEGLRRSSEWLRRYGNFEVGSTRARVTELLASPLKVSYLELKSTAPTEVPPIPADLDLFTYRLDVDLRAYDAVDVIVETASGEYLKTFRDVSYDREDGALYGICHAPLAEISFRRGPTISKVMAGHGAERQLVATFEVRPAR